MAINVRAIANGAIQSVNPDVSAVLMKSTGYTSSPSSKRTPTYRNILIVCQVQALSFSDLSQLDGLNIQGVRRAIYVQTQVAAIIRVMQKGGDLIVFPKGTPGVQEGTTWLAAHVLERWATWCKIAITLQIDNLDADAC